jgi:hypothetical protein
VAYSSNPAWVEHFPEAIRRVAALDDLKQFLKQLTLHEV